MAKDYLEFFQASYQRAVAAPGQKDEFFDTFYDLFMAKSPEIAARFAGTDMGRQKRMLAESLRHMVEFSIQRRASETLHRVADRHGRRQLDIRPELYDSWLQSLLETVAIFDLEYNDEIDLAWRVVLAPGIAYMKHRYDRA